MEKNSEDEDGQLEEQIERLQEKVESAQSEQKNLFLVIFQVRPEPGSGSLLQGNQLHIIQCVWRPEKQYLRWNFVLQFLKTTGLPQSNYISRLHAQVKVWLSNLS